MSDSVRLKISEKLKGHKVSSELREKISLATKKGMARPEVREKVVALKGNGNGFKSGSLNPMFGKRDAEASNWKGDSAGYQAIHVWVASKKGKPTKCEKCGVTDLKKRNGYRGIEWANVDHKYRRVIDDYIALCNKCHTNYDRINNGKKFHEQNREIRRSNS